MSQTLGHVTDAPYDRVVSPVLVALLGCCAVLAFDAAGSFVARWLGFRYALLAPGSLAFYAATGFLAAREVDWWLVGAAAAAAVAAVEATIGWRVARAVGVDSEENVTPDVEMGVTTVVTLSGAILGALAGLAA